MRWVLVGLLLVFACNDLRAFQGDWRGPQVGDTPVRLGLDSQAPVAARLAIDQVDGHGLAGRLAIDDALPETPLASLPGAEADVLAGLTFSGGPLRVYLAFVAMPTGGDALVVIALYDDRRVELRVLRGGASPLYAIFALTEQTE